MPSRPRLLDLFCGAGGAAVGYHRAGFDVVGVDIQPQPRYPFEFHQGDALGWLRAALALDAAPSFDAIHASPPCQAFTNARVIYGNDHPDLLTPTRELLKATGVPWVIENVPGAPMRKDLILCGTMFGLEDERGQLRRHRWFEFSDQAAAPLAMPCRHEGTTISVFGHGGHVYHGVQHWRDVMDTQWMARDEIAQAIPPAYTEFIGTQLVEQLRQAA